MRALILLFVLANPDGDCTKSADCERGSYCKSGTWEAAAHAIIEGALQKQPFRPQGLGHHLFASSHHLLAAASEPEVMPPKDHG